MRVCSPIAAGNDRQAGDEADPGALFDVVPKYLYRYRQV